VGRQHALKEREVNEKCKRDVGTEENTCGSCGLDKQRTVYGAVMNLWVSQKSVCFSIVEKTGILVSILIKIFMCFFFS